MLLATSNGSSLEEWNNHFLSRILTWRPRASTAVSGSTPRQPTKHQANFSTFKKKHDGTWAIGDAVGDDNKKGKSPLRRAQTSKQQSKAAELNIKA